jgi:hypothetical protein
MKTWFLVLLVVAAILPSCAGSRSTSEREWARAQCDQVIDSEARKKCLERADR